MRCFAIALLLCCVSRMLAAAPGRDGYPATADEQAAVTAMEEGRFVRARALAERILERSPHSHVGHLVLGVALKEGEGNLPLALKQLRQARATVELSPGIARLGQRGWHRDILFQLRFTLSDLGMYDELLAINQELRGLYEPQAFSLDVWPLMKLGRIEQARAAAAEALATKDPFEEVVARNGLCAIDGYPACIATLEAVRRHDFDPGLALRNAGVSALESGRLAEAEKLLLASTDYPTEEINPFRDLTMLYTSQARLTEAVDAARRMNEFSRRLPRRQRQYTRGGELTTAGELLLIAGRSSHAVEAADRALEEPDRAAHWSGSAREINAEAALLARRARLTLSEQLDEASAVLGPIDALPSRWSSLKLRLAAWLDGRAIVPLLLAGGFRPRAPEDAPDRPELSAPDWLFLDAIELFGPRAALSLARSERAAVALNSGPIPKQVLQLTYDAIEVEALCLVDRSQACLLAGEALLKQIPTSMALLRSRTLTRLAQQAYRQGDQARAWSYFGELLTRDPGALRRLGVALPVSVVSPSDGLLSEALERALSTPRFVEDSASPFRLQASANRLCLFGRGDAALACASDPGEARDVAAATANRSSSPTIVVPPAETAKTAAQRIALQFLSVAFSPRVSLSQSDLQSLDGSPLVDRQAPSGAIEGILDERR